MTCLAQVNDVRQGSSKLITAHDSVLFKDRKSTRLNSSHSQISYAVFCLKKKNAVTIPVGVGLMGAQDAVEPRSSWFYGGTGLAKQSSPGCPSSSGNPRLIHARSTSSWAL